MHIPSFWVQTGNINLSMKRRRNTKITVPKVELQADATDHLVKLQKTRD